MRILYLHQYFKTPDEGGPIRSYYLAKGLVENGFEVELITSHNKGSEEIKIVDGIRVHYLPVTYDNTMGFTRRSVSFILFMILAIKKASTLKNIDCCYATSTPLTIGWAAIKIKKKLQIPYLFEVRDLWPEAPIQMGSIRSAWLQRILVKIEQRIYKHANRIVALSPGIQEGIQKLEPSRDIALIPNMSDIDFFEPSEKDQELEVLLGVKNQFVISYFGALGKSNNLEFLLDVAKASKSGLIDLTFLIIGVGSEVGRLKKIARHEELDNVQFLDFMNKVELKRVLTITDAAYVSFANIPILETNSPNKFFDALASGKLVITNTKGWVKELCESNNCGFYADPLKPE